MERTVKERSLEAKREWMKWYLREYLLSDHWQDKRKATLDYFDHKCAKCGREYNLHAHHTNYKHLWCERVGIDTVSRCEDCHAEGHGLEVESDEAVFEYSVN